MVNKHRYYNPEFKKETVRLADESGKPVAEVARDLGLHRNLIYRWRKEFQQGGQEAFPGQGNLPGRRGRNAAVETRVGGSPPGAGHNKKSAGLLRRGKQMRFRFIRQHSLKMSIALGKCNAL